MILSALELRSIDIGRLTDIAGPDVALAAEQLIDVLELVPRRVILDRLQSLQEWMRNNPYTHVEPAAPDGLPHHPDRPGDDGYDNGGP